MQLILIMAEAMGLVVGSLTAAALLCWFLWHAFRLVLHPEWAALAVLALSGLALIGELPKSQLLEMTMTFAAFAAVPIWFAGRSWRKERRQRSNGARGRSLDRGPSGTTGLPEPALSPRLYPAICACICEDRSPTRSEVHIVASRLWREGLAHRFGSLTMPASFAARRLLLRAATAALTGKHLASRPKRIAGRL